MRSFHFGRLKLELFHRKGSVRLVQCSLGKGTWFAAFIPRKADPFPFFLNSASWKTFRKLLKGHIRLGVSLKPVAMKGGRHVFLR